MFLSVVTGEYIVNKTHGVSQQSFTLPQKKMGKKVVARTAADLPALGASSAVSPGVSHHRSGTNP